MINIVVALSCEAKPIIKHFGLSPQHRDTAYKLYGSGNINLIVSGVGKHNAAAATNYIAGNNTQHTAWLNVGIAGHASKPLGSGFIAHKITDQSSQKYWHPHPIDKLELASEALLTVDHTKEEYLNDTLIDMEASGFYAAACRFTDPDLVQCYKIVSDNQLNTVSNINAVMVSELIQNDMANLELTLSHLEKIINP